MQNILVLRRDNYDNQMLKDILASLPFKIYDVTRVDQVQIKKISSNLEIDIRFKGKSIGDFDFLVYINTPFRNYDSDDEIFAASEFEAALRVAIKISRIKLINPGMAGCYHRGLVTPVVICNQLREAGWKVPSVYYGYDKNQNKAFFKKISPAPVSPYCLYLTVNDYFVMPGIKVHFNYQSKFLELICNTQKHMIAKGYDFLVLGIFRKDDEFYVYSHFTDLPPDTNTTFLKRLLLDVLL